MLQTEFFFGSFLTSSTWNFIDLPSVKLLNGYMDLIFTVDIHYFSCINGYKGITYALHEVQVLSGQLFRRAEFNAQLHQRILFSFHTNKFIQAKCLD